MRPEQKTLHEIFTEVASAKTKSKKKEILLAHNLLHVRDVLRASFDNQIHLDLPEGAPPSLNENKEVVVGNGRITRCTKSLVYFVKGAQQYISNTVKRETMWLNMLETVTEEDARVLTAMKDKNLNTLYKGLTKQLVKEVWPNLIRD